jgi:hypothetical protein
MRVRIGQVVVAARRRITTIVPAVSTSNTMTARPHCETAGIIIAEQAPISMLAAPPHGRLMQQTRCWNPVLASQFPLAGLHSSPGLNTPSAASQFACGHSAVGADAQPLGSANSQQLLSVASAFCKVVPKDTVKITHNPKNPKPVLALRTMISFLFFLASSLTVTNWLSIPIPNGLGPRYLDFTRMRVRPALYL